MKIRSNFDSSSSSSNSMSISSDLGIKSDDMDDSSISSNISTSSNTISNQENKKRIENESSLKKSFSLSEIKEYDEEDINQEDVENKTNSDQWWSDIGIFIQKNKFKVAGFAIGAQLALATAIHLWNDEKRKKDMKFS